MILGTNKWKKTIKLGQSESGQNQEYKTVLADVRRRFVLNDLLTHIHPVPVYDLTHRMLAWGVEHDVEGVESVRFEDLREDLAEAHLPRLEAAGLVETVDGERYTLTNSAMELEAMERDLDQKSTARRAD